MAQLRVDQVQAGMELAADVLDRNGQLLIRAGTVVTDRELRLFKMWGVDALDVAGLDDELVENTPELDPELAAQFEPVAREIFRHCDLEHPFVQQMYQHCITKLAHEGGP